MCTTLEAQTYFYFQNDIQSDASTQDNDQCINFNKHNCRQQLYEGSKTLHKTKLKVKSSLCKNYTMNGNCPYGDKCQFAHGTHQLRCNEEINLSYKTKYCNSFLNKKCCLYGIRCNFIHKNNAKTDLNQKWANIYTNHRDTLKECRNQNESRLLSILNEQ